MKRAADALGLLLARVGAGIGLEGAFLGAGTGLIAYGAGLISPAGPWLVTGVIALLAGIALALPRRA